MGQGGRAVLLSTAVVLNQSLQTTFKTQVLGAVFAVLIFILNQVGILKKQSLLKDLLMSNLFGIKYDVFENSNKYS